MTKVLIILILLSTIMKEESILDGKQLKDWSKTNLTSRTFRNGDSLLFAKSPDEWKYASENSIPACCYVGFDSESDSSEKYGLLYNGYAVADPRGLAPEGWEIPSVHEWKNLVERFAREKTYEIFFYELGQEYGNENKNEDEIIFYSDRGFCDYGGRVERGIVLYWTSDCPTKPNLGTFFSYAGNEIIISEFHLSSGLYVRCIKSD